MKITLKEALETFSVGGLAGYLAGTLSAELYAYLFGENLWPLIVVIPLFLIMVAQIGSYIGGHLAECNLYQEHCEEWTAYDMKPYPFNKFKREILNK